MYVLSVVRIANRDDFQIIISRRNFTFSLSILSPSMGVGSF